LLRSSASFVRERAVFIELPRIELSKM